MSRFNSIEISESESLNVKERIPKTRLVLVKNYEDKQKFWNAKKVEYLGKIVIDDNGNEVLVAKKDLPTHLPIVQSAFCDESQNIYSHKKCKSPSLITVQADVHMRPIEHRVKHKVETSASEHLISSTTQLTCKVISPNSEAIHTTDTIELISTEITKPKRQTRVRKIRKVLRKKWDSFLDCLFSKFNMSCCDTVVV